MRMKKPIGKILLRIALSLLAALIGLLVLLFVLIHIPAIQNAALQRGLIYWNANQLSQLSVEYIQLKLWKSIELEGVNLSDAQGDTVFSLQRFYLHFNIAALQTGTIHIRAIDIDQPMIHLVQMQDSTWNIQHLISQDSSVVVPEDTVSSVFGMRVRLDTCMLNGARLKLNLLDKHSMEWDSIGFSFRAAYQHPLAEMFGFRMQIPGNELNAHARVQLDLADTSHAQVYMNRIHLEPFYSFLPNEFHWKQSPDFRLNLMFNDRWASAKMELQSQDQNLTVHVEVEDWKGIPKHRINLSMHAFKPDDWYMGIASNGLIHGNAHWYGQGLTPESMQGDLRLTVFESQVFDVPIDTLTTDLTYQSGALDGLLRYQSNWASIRIEPHIQNILNDRSSYQIQMQAHRVMLDDLVEDLSLPDPFELNVRLKGQGLTAQNARLQIDSLYVATRGLMLNAQGIVDVNRFSEGSVALYLNDRDVVGSMAGIDSLEVQGSIHARLNGTKHTQQADILLRLHKPVYGSYAFDSLQTQVDLSLHQFTQMGAEIDLILDQMQARVETSVDFSASLQGWLRALSLRYDTLHWKQSMDTAFFEISPTRYAIHGFKMESGQQTLGIEGVLDFKDNQAFQLKMDKLSVSDLTHLFMQELNLNGNVDLRVDIQGPAAMPAVLLDLDWKDAAYESLTTRGFHVSSVLQDSTLKTQMDMLPLDSGQVAVFAALPMRLNLENQRLRIPTMQDTVHAEIQIVNLDVRALNSFIPYESTTKGVLNAMVQIRDRMDSIQPTGDLTLQDAALEIPTFGVYYPDIQASVSTENRHVYLDTLLIRSKRGNLTGGGTFSMDTADVQLVFNKFRPVDHSSYNLQLDGQIQWSGKGNRSRFDGDLEIPKAEVYLPAVMRLMGKSTAPTGSKPLLLAALEDQQREGEAFELNGEVLAVDSVKVMPFIENLQGRVRIKIPRNTWIKNDDMRIELAGDVELVKHSETVELFGSVDVVRGQYDLLGKVFVVQEGKIGFEGGDKINPSLQVVAVYSFRDTEKNKRELSIDVSGYADAPVLSFQLDGTTVDEGNALSYMLFGKDLDALSSSDRSNVDQGASTLQLAQSAALSLLSSRLTNVLGKAFQVDYVEYKSGSTLGEGSFVVGKYVTNNLFVSYERNFGEAAQEEQLVEYEMRMEYELFRFLFLQLTSAPTRNGFDVIFKF